MPNIVQITVKTKAEDLLRFMLYHGFSKPSGLITLTASIISLVCLPFSIFMWKDQFVTIALALMVFIYLIMTPLNMFAQSKRQVTSNPVFKNPITYHISSEIFEVQQYTGTLRLFWSQLINIKITPFDYLFYVNDEQAFVVPKKSISPDELITLNEILDQVKKELNQEPIKPDESFNIKGKSKESKISGVEKQLQELAMKDVSEEGHHESAKKNTNTNQKPKSVQKPYQKQNYKKKQNQQARRKHVLDSIEGSTDINADEIIDAMTDVSTDKTIDAMTDVSTDKTITAMTDVSTDKMSVQ